MILSDHPGYSTLNSRLCRFLYLLFVQETDHGSSEVDGEDRETAVILNNSTFDWDIDIGPGV